MEISTFLIPRKTLAKSSHRMIFIGKEKPQITANLGFQWGDSCDFKVHHDPWLRL